MQANEYVQECLKTEARDFTPVIERFKDPALAALTFQLFAEMSHISGVLDAVKKNIFYGKEVDGIAEAKSSALIEASNNGVIDILEVAQNTINSDVKNIRILHSITGMASEMKELIECFMGAMAEGNPIDVVNYLEEHGDLDWYQAIGVDAVGSDFETIWKMNRDKLAKRYAGQKFTEDQANNRDLQTERNTLEGNV